MSQIRSKYRKLSKLVKLSSNYIHEFGFSYFINAAVYEFKKHGLGVFAPEPLPHSNSVYSETLAYNEWLVEHQITEDIKSKMKRELQEYSKKPKISIILSISEKNKQYLKITLCSIIEQTYDNLEIHFAYSKSILDEINRISEEIPDSRLISNPELEQTDSLNRIASSVTGDFILFVNSGDVLTEDALFSMFQILNKNPDADIIYFDEDQINQNSKRIKPFFKPDWSPDLFLSFDYISNFYSIRTSLFKKSGGFNDQFHTAKHYELLLRLTDFTKKIIHVPTIVISIRNDNDNKLAQNFEQDAKKALLDTLVRRGINGQVINGFLPATFRIKYFSDKKPRVTIIIPTKDKKDLLKRCITSIEKNTTYKNYEIIIVDNNSVKEETLSYLKSLPYKIIRYDFPFNFSKINNLAVSQSSGDYLLFLNDDVAPLEADWLSEMISIAQQENVGVVGAKLVLSDNTIQHAGVVFLKTGAGFHPLQGVDSDSQGYFGFLNVIRNYSAVTGACLLISKKIFEEIGGFDEKFDLYYGDTDLCLKSSKNGYKIVYTPYAKLLHQGSSSIKEHTNSFFAVENHYSFLNKWPYLKNGDPFYNPNLMWDYIINTDAI